MRPVNRLLVLNLPAFKRLLNKLVHSLIAFFLCVFKYSNPTGDGIMDVGFYHKYLWIRYMSHRNQAFTEIKCLYFFYKSFKTVFTDNICYI
jgi:hypothetical protein